MVSPPTEHVVVLLSYPLDGTRRLTVIETTDSQRNRFVGVMVELDDKTIRVSELLEKFK